MNDVRAGRAWPRSFGGAALCWGLLVWLGPGFLSAQPARVWVAAEGSNSVLAIDPLTNGVVATVPVAGTPANLAATPDGSRVFVPGRASNQITVINTSTYATTPLTHPSLREPVAVAFVPTRGEAWVLNRQGGPSNTGSISVFNIGSLAFVTEITSPSFSLPVHLAVDLGATRAFVVNGGNATMTMLLTSSRAVVFSVAVGVAPRFVVPTSVFAYVSNSGSGDLSRVNLASRVELRVPIGGQPTGMAFDVASNRLLVALQNDRVGTYNTQTQDLGQILVGDSNFISHSVALLAGTSLAYVTDAGGNRVAAFNLASLSMVTGNGFPIGPLSSPRSITATGTVAVADLSVSLTDNPDPVSGGQPLTYGVQVQNGGPSPAEGSQLVLQTTGQFEFVSSSLPEGACEALGQTVVCDLGTLAYQQILNVTLQIRPLTAGSFGATVNVASDLSDPNAADNTASVTTSVIPAADLRLDVTDSPDPVAVGGLLTYVITVSNAGPLQSEGVRLFDPLPPGLELSSVSGGLANCTGGSTSVICNLESLLPGSSAQVVIEAIPTAAGRLLNGVDVRAMTADPVDSNNSVVVSTTVVAGGADLGLVKTSLSPLAYSGSTTPFRFRVSNLGPNPAAGIEVRDMLAEGLEFGSAVPLEGVQCVVEEDVLVCRIGSLASGASIDVMVALRVSAFPGTVLSNNATVSAVGPDPDPANNESTATVRVTQKGDVNGDGNLDAADVQSLIIELNDGDGVDVSDVAGGGFAGNASMDLNGDGRITRSDLSELIDLIFG